MVGAHRHARSALTPCTTPWNAFRQALEEIQIPAVCVRGARPLHKLDIFSSARSLAPRTHTLFLPVRHSLAKTFFTHPQYSGAFQALRRFQSRAPSSVDRNRVERGAHRDACHAYAIFARLPSAYPRCTSASDMRGRRRLADAMCIAVVCARIAGASTLIFRCPRVAEQSSCCFSRCADGGNMKATHCASPSACEYATRSALHTF